MEQMRCKAVCGWHHCQTRENLMPDDDSQAPVGLLPPVRLCLHRLSGLRRSWLVCGRPVCPRVGKPAIVLIRACRRCPSPSGPLARSGRSQVIIPRCMRGRGSMGLVNLGVFRGVETHRGVEGDDCASSLTTRFFSQVFLQRNPGRAGLGCEISGLRSGGMMPRARRG